MNAHNPRFDIIIVGSGPSGANAALESVRAGMKTCLVDISHTDETYAPHIPGKSFSDIRQHEENQAHYFLGETEEDNAPARAGIHLTPPRRHVIRDAEEHFPTENRGFFALQSTSLGGLGAGWGANAFALEDAELEEIGIPPEEIRPFYRSVSEDIGLSGDVKGDTYPLVAQGLAIQPPLPIDTNAESIFTRYRALREKLKTHGFVMGQSLLAVLSRPLGNRRANPLHDMDFWSDNGKSVYRPRYTLEDIASSPHAHLFTHLRGKLVMRFEEHDEGVLIEARDIAAGEVEKIQGKKLLLAAGAINSARIALRSFGDYAHKAPLLCNHNLWIAALNLSMLGRPARDERYSLAQLTALMPIPERFRNGTPDYLLAQFYSYRSLLLHRLLKDIPLPPRLGLLFLRLTETCLTMINVHFGDRQNPLRYLKLSKDKKGEGDTLEIHSQFSPEEESLFARYERKFKRILFSLRIIPLSTARPIHGASIHYAGTLPYSDKSHRATCDRQGKLRETNHVFIADGSTWKFLPSKGLTLTLMANARRIARCAIAEIKAR